jgi:hypothetical protein
MMKRSIVKNNVAWLLGMMISIGYVWASMPPPRMKEDIARDEVTDQWTELAMKRGVQAANEAMVKLAFDANADLFRRAAAMRKLEGPVSVGLRDRIEDVQDTASKERLRGPEGWRQLDSATERVLWYLPYYEAKTPQAQYTVLTNMYVKGDVEGPYAQRLIGMIGDRAWALIEKKVEDRARNQSEYDRQYNPDYHKYLREVFLLQRLSNEDPAGYTNRLETIAGVELVRTKDHRYLAREEMLRFQHAEEKAKQRAAPYLERAGKSAESLKWYAYEKLTNPLEKAQLESLCRLWDAKRITTTDIQQSKEPQLKELAEKYILTTNLPPWEAVWKNRW